MLLLMCLPAMAETKSVYTDVKKCAGEDTEWDMFFHECKGPNGRVVSLIYSEGIARIVVDEDTSSPAAEVEIPVGGNGKVFGDKLEWRVRDGKPCAVIARVSTNRGSRLIVTSLAKPAQIFAWDHTNNEARATSELACDSVDKPYTPDGELSVETRGDWTVSGACNDPGKITIGPTAVTLTSPERSIEYKRVETAHAYLHGARYDGIEYAYLAYPEGGDMIETVIVVNAGEQEGRIELRDIPDSLKDSFSGILGKPLTLCK